MSSLLYLIIGLVVAFYPVVAIIPYLLGVTSTPISITYRFTYSVLSIILVTSALIIPKSFKLTTGRFAVITFYFLYIVRLIVDLYIRDVPAYESDSYFMQYAVGGTFLPLLAVLFVGKRLQPSLVIKTLYIFSVLSCIAIFFMILKEGGLVQSALENRIMIVGESSRRIVGPIIVSREGGVLAVVAFFSFLRANSFPKLAFHLSLFCFGMLLLIVGASRGPLVSVLIILVLQILVHYVQNWNKLWYYLRSGIALFGLAIAAIIFLIPRLDAFSSLSLVSRFSLFSERGFDLGTRSYQWEAAFTQIKSSPFFGERFVENLFNHSPHNFYIEIVLAMGVLGLLLFLMPLMNSVINFTLEAKAKSTFLVVHFLFWLYMLYGMTGISIHTNPQVWVLLGLTLFISFKLQNGKNEIVQKGTFPT